MKVEGESLPDQGSRPGNEVLMVFGYEPTPMLTVKDVARLLNVSVNTVRRWSDSKIIKSYRITRRGDRRYRQEDISSFLVGYNDFNSRKGRLQVPFVYGANVTPAPPSAFYAVLKNR